MNPGPGLLFQLLYSLIQAPVSVVVLVVCVQVQPGAEHAAHDAGPHGLHRHIAVPAAARVRVRLLARGVGWWRGQGWGCGGGGVGVGVVAGWE